MFAVLSIIPTALVHKLSQDLNWRLSTVLLNLWHIQVIDKDYTTFRIRWCEYTLSSLLQLRIDNVLYRIAMGLSRESNFDGFELIFGQLGQENILNVN